MADPFLGEIRITSFAFAPSGWALCFGNVLSVQQNQALFSLLGFSYGGNGTTTFALPDFRGRVPVDSGAGRQAGERGGVQTHALTLAQTPGHTHVLQASADPATSFEPANHVLARTRNELYREPTDLADMSADSIGNAGASQAHTNMQPYLTLSFMIAVAGNYPPRP